MTTETPKNETTADYESNRPKISVDLSRLPCSLNVPGFDEGYLAHQKEEKSKEAISMIITGLGILLAIIGGLIIIFGPSHVRISYSGPTFTEFFLLYPGPITTAGGLIAVLGGKMGPAIKLPLVWLDEHYNVDLKNQETLSGPVIFDYQGNNTFLVSMEAPDGKEENSSDPVN